MRPIFSSSASTAPRCFWMAATLGAKFVVRYWNMLPREIGGRIIDLKLCNPLTPTLSPPGRGGAPSMSDHRSRRQSVDIGHNIDHGGPVRHQRLRKRRWKRRSLFDANAERAHILRDAREIDLAEGP